MSYEVTGGTVGSREGPRQFLGRLEGGEFMGFWGVKGSTLKELSFCDSTTGVCTLPTDG